MAPSGSGCPFADINNLVAFGGLFPNQIMRTRDVGTCRIHGGQPFSRAFFRTSGDTPCAVKITVPESI